MNRSDKLAMLRDPSYAHTIALRELLGRVQPIPGQHGRTPERGVDYFTREDIAAIVSEVRAMVKDGYTPVKGVDYQDGETPVKGTHYFDGKPGKHAKAPVKGVDYWTQEEQDAIIVEAAARVKVKDGVSPKITDIIAAILPVLKSELSYSHIKDAPDLKDLPELIAFLKRGGFRGGGGSSGAAGNTTKTIDLSSQCDGVNKVFTYGTAITTVLTLIGSDSPMVYRPTNDFTQGATSITLAAGTPAPSAGATLISTYV